MIRRRDEQRFTVYVDRDEFLQPKRQWTRQRSPLIPSSSGNAPARRPRRPAQQHCGEQNMPPTPNTARHEQLSPVWCTPISCEAAAAPPKRQRRSVRQQFPLLRLVLTRPHQRELQRRMELHRLVKAFEADAESLTLDQLLQAAAAASPPASAEPLEEATEAQPSPRRTISGERARRAFERAVTGPTEERSET